MTVVLAAASAAAVLALKPVLAREAPPACDAPCALPESVAEEGPECLGSMVTMWMGPEGVIHSESTEPVPVDCDQTMVVVVVGGGSGGAADGAR
jgi:hypothetical protein